MRIRYLLVLALLTLSLGGFLPAQAQQFVLRTSVFSAGAQQSTVGNLVLQSTVGQPFVYSASNSNFEVKGGFWPSVTNAAGPQALPTPANDTATTDEDTAVEINVLVNDTNPGGGSLTIIDFGAPAHGEAILSGEGIFTYQPEANFFGEDGFVYAVQNEQGGRAEATVVITVIPVGLSVGRPRFRR